MPVQNNFQYSPAVSILTHFPKPNILQYAIAFNDQHSPICNSTQRSIFSTIQHRSMLAHIMHERNIPAHSPVPIDLSNWFARVYKILPTVVVTKNRSNAIVEIPVGTFNLPNIAMFNGNLGNLCSKNMQFFENHPIHITSILLCTVPNPTIQRKTSI
jgi:hypothetical protein